MIFNCEAKGVDIPFACHCISINKGNNLKETHANSFLIYATTKIGCLRNRNKHSPKCNLA